MPMLRPFALHFLLDLLTHPLLQLLPVFQQALMLLVAGVLLLALGFLTDLGALHCLLTALFARAPADGVGQVLVHGPAERLALRPGAPEDLHQTRNQLPSFRQTMLIDQLRRLG